MKPFGNIISKSILVTMIVLVCLGVFLMFFTTGWLSGIGLILVVAGAAIWFTGETSLKKDPPTAGLLHCWNRPIIIDGKPVCVGGKTLIANWFPFYISLVETDTSNHDKEFPVEVTSCEPRTNFDGRVSVTYCANTNDLVDFVKAGNSFGEVDSQLKDIVVQVAKSEASTRTTDQLITDTRDIAEIIKSKMEAGSFGITIKKVQVVLSVSRDVKVAMDKTEIERFQRVSERADYETIRKSARELQDAYAADPYRTTPVPSLEICIQQVLAQKLIEQGKTSAIQGAGQIFGVVSTPAPGSSTP